MKWEKKKDVSTMIESRPSRIKDISTMIESRHSRIKDIALHHLLCHHNFAAAATKCTKKFPLCLRACAYVSPWTLPTYFWHKYFLYGLPLDKLTYISREISIEHPSVGLASLAQLTSTGYFILWIPRSVIPLHHYNKIWFSFWLTSLTKLWHIR